MELGFVASKGVRTALAAGPGLVVAALMPKCPLCVAALLSSLGFGVALASHLAPWVRPLAFGISGLAVFVSIVVVARNRRVSRPSGGPIADCCRASLRRRARR